MRGPAPRTAAARRPLPPAMTGRTVYDQDRPCPSCPWWTTNPTDGTRIVRFNLTKMLALRATVGPGDAFRPIMACHASPEGGDWPCVGYVARHGLSNLALRVIAANERLDLVGIVEGCADLPLYPSFDAMLDAYLTTLSPEDHDPCTRTCAADAADAPPDTETRCP